MKHLKTLAFSATVALMASAAFAQDVKWDMANEFQASSIHGQAQQVFTDAVAENSGGSIEITNHFSASLGYKSREQFDAVADGALPIANTNTGPIAGIEPLFLVSSLPFLVRGADDAKILWETAKPYYDEIFEANNQIMLYASPWPPAGIWAKAPIDSSEAIAGVKTRAWDASGTTTLKNVGAAAIQMAWSDVVPQLATGGIDAVLTSAEGGVNAKFWEHLTHFSAINYSMNLNITHVNADAFNALTEDQKAAVLAAAATAQTFAWDALAERVASNYADMNSNGITVVESVPDAFLAELSEAGQQVYSDWLEKTGDTGQALLDAYNAARGM